MVSGASPSRPAKTRIIAGKARVDNSEAFAFFRLLLRLMAARAEGVSSLQFACSSGSTNNDKRIGLQSREGIKKVAEEKVNPSNNNII